ncbi:MAG: CoA transferase subunit A [Chloroflexi bacterium]|nr:CoA transferase subunit A [Chloroflexota bacterium]
MTDKRISLAQAAELVGRGDTLALGGMTLYRRPVAFVRELIRRARRDPESGPGELTLLCFTAGYESDLLVGAGLVRRVRSCYFGLEAFGFAPMFTEAANRGQIEVLEESEASIAFGLRAALATVGFMPGRGWLGTDLPRLRPEVKTVTDPYSGEELIAFPAIAPDVAVIHALQADPTGNALIGDNRGVDIELSLAARTVIITAEKIVERLDHADVAGLTVAVVAPAPRGALPTSCHPLYPVAGGELLAYIEACNAGDFERYLLS